MLDEEKRHLGTFERKVKKSRGFSSDAEDISEELDVSKRKTHLLSDKIFETIFISLKIYTLSQFYKIQILSSFYIL